MFDTLTTRFERCRGGLATVQVVAVNKQPGGGVVVTLERRTIGPPVGEKLPLPEAGVPGLGLPTGVEGNQPLSGTGLGGNSFSVAPGQVVGLIGAAGYGMTRIGLTMLAEHAHVGTVAYLDVRGWMSPLAAWESGIPEDRLVVVRCDGPIEWGRVGSTLLEGVVAMYAEVPRGAKDAQLRTLATLARTRRAPLILRPLGGDLPGGVTQLRLDAQHVAWEGAEDGHGAIQQRHLVLEASGKLMRGMTRTIEMEDHGADALRVVSGLATAPTGRAVG